jgi:rhodanese-related sulfurtransferase
VCEEGKEKESINRLARVGYDKAKGFLKGGVQAWKSAGNQVKSLESIQAANFSERINNTCKILDVRNEGEWASGVVKNATTIPLAKLEESLSTLDKNAHYYVYCRSGYRSMIGASILQKHGFNKITNVIGGMNAISKTPVVIEVPEIA